MTIIDILFSYGLLGVILGFVVLLHFLLKYRNKLFNDNLLLTADQVWLKVSEQAIKFNLLKSDMLFGLGQNVSIAVAGMIVKDFESKKVGELTYTMMFRKNTMLINEQKFIIVFPLTWNKTANLINHEGLVVATYAKKGFFKTQFEVKGFGKIESNCFSFNTRNETRYYSNNQLIGLAQRIPGIQNRGRIIFLPESLPIEVKIFILSF